MTIKLKKYQVPRSAITEKGLKKLVKRSIEDSGLSLTEWANEKGVTPQAVSAFLRNRQTAGIQIPAIFGYMPQIAFLPEGEDPISKPKGSRKSKKKGKKHGDDKRSARRKKLREK